MSKKLTQLPAAALSELDDTEIIAATVTPGATPVSKTITTRRLRQRLIGAQGYKRGEDRGERSQGRREFFEPVGT